MRGGKVRGASLIKGQAAQFNGLPVLEFVAWEMDLANTHQKLGFCIRFTCLDPMILNSVTIETFEIQIDFIKNLSSSHSAINIDTLCLKQKLKV